MTGKNTPPEILKREIDEARDRIKFRMAKTVQDIIEIGHDLIEVKNKLVHGDFQNWVRLELGVSPRTAQNFMNASTHLGGKSGIISHLPPTVIYTLAAPSTPIEVRKNLLKLAEDGDFIAEMMVKEHRERAVPSKRNSKAEKDAAEPNSTAVTTSETKKTNVIGPPNAQDTFNDAYQAVLDEEGEDSALDIIRKLMPNLAITMADVEVADLLAELEARGREVAEEGLLQLARKWAGTGNMEVIIKPKAPSTSTGASAPDHDDDLLAIPDFLDRQGGAA